LKNIFKFVPDEVPEDLGYGVKTIPEEIANIVSHGIGLLLFLIGSPLLIYKAATSSVDYYLIGCAIFCTSLLMVYASSTIYHSTFRAQTKRRMRIVDHVSIYFLITGSFTPFLLITIQSKSGDWVLITLWVMVIVGSIFKLFYTHKFKTASTLAYVLMGTVSFFFLEPLEQNLPDLSYLFLQIGIYSYLIGVPFYLWRKLYFNHLVWHIFVLGGSVSHFLAVWYMVR
jgi:hemolysin III